MKDDNGMGLQSFVRDALVEIIVGVDEAAKRVRMEHVGPTSVRGAVNAGETASEVEFDVSVTVSHSGTGEVGLRVPYFTAGGKVSAGEETINRLKFAVPVAFASQPVGPEYTRTDPPGPPPGETSLTVGKPGSTDEGSS